MGGCAGVWRGDVVYVAVFGDGYLFFMGRIKSGVKYCVVY
jgi:hypothetical protein